MANQERDLRVKKLYHQIGNLCATYDTTRRDDEHVTAADLLARFDPELVPATPWTFDGVSI